MIFSVIFLLVKIFSSVSGSLTAESNVKIMFDMVKPSLSQLVSSYTKSIGSSQNSLIARRLRFSPAHKDADSDILVKCITGATLICLEFGEPQATEALNHVIEMIISVTPETRVARELSVLNPITQDFLEIMIHQISQEKLLQMIHSMPRIFELNPKLLAKIDDFSSFTLEMTKSIIQRNFPFFNALTHDGIVRTIPIESLSYLIHQRRFNLGLVESELIQRFRNGELSKLDRAGLVLITKMHSPALELVSGKGLLKALKSRTAKTLSAEEKVLLCAWVLRNELVIQNRLENLAKFWAKMHMNDEVEYGYTRFIDQSIVQAIEQRKAAKFSGILQNFSAELKPHMHDRRSFLEVLKKAEGCDSLSSLLQTTFNRMLHQYFSGNVENLESASVKIEPEEILESPRLCNEIYKFIQTFDIYEINATSHELSIQAMRSKIFEKKAEIQLLDVYFAALCDPAPECNRLFVRRTILAYNLGRIPEFLLFEFSAKFGWISDAVLNETIAAGFKQVGASMHVASIDQLNDECNSIVESLVFNQMSIRAEAGPSAYFSIYEAVAKSRAISNSLEYRFEGRILGFLEIIQAIPSVQCIFSTVSGAMSEALSRKLLNSAEGVELLSNYLSIFGNLRCFAQCPARILFDKVSELGEFSFTADLISLTAAVRAHQGHLNFDSNFVYGVHVGHWGELRFTAAAWETLTMPVMLEYPNEVCYEKCGLFVIASSVVDQLDALELLETETAFQAENVKIEALKYEMINSEADLSRTLLQKQIILIAKWLIMQELHALTSWIAMSQRPELHTWLAGQYNNYTKFEGSARTVLSTWIKAKLLENPECEELKHLKTIVIKSPLSLIRFFFMDANLKQFSAFTKGEDLLALIPRYSRYVFSILKKFLNRPEEAHSLKIWENRMYLLSLIGGNGELLEQVKNSWIRSIFIDTVGCTVHIPDAVMIFSTLDILGIDVISSISGKVTSETQFAARKVTPQGTKYAFNAKPPLDYVFKKLAVEAKLQAAKEAELKSKIK